MDKHYSLSFPDLDRESPAGQLLRQNLPEITASMPAPPEPSQCLAEELIDLSKYWLTVLARLVEKIAFGDALARYGTERIELLMAEDAMMDVGPVDSLNDKIRALKYVALLLVSYCRVILMLIKLDVWLAYSIRVGSSARIPGMAQVSMGHRLPLQIIQATLL